MQPTTSTVDPSVRVDRAAGRVVETKRRALYAFTTSVLTLLVGLAAVDGAGVLDVYGVDTAVVAATGSGMELDVRYATVSRSGIATPFEITVRRAGGFDEAVRVAVDTDYLAMWDENGLDPDPAAATADDRRVVWEFDPPAGDTLVVSYDARIEPAAQRGNAGRVAVVDDASVELVAVTFRTRILP